MLTIVHKEVAVGKDNNLKDNYFMCKGKQVLIQIQFSCQ